MMKEIVNELGNLNKALNGATDAFYKLKREYLASKYKNKRSKRLNKTVRTRAWGYYVAYGMTGSFESYLNNFKCSDIELTKFFISCNDTELIDNF